MWTSSGRIRKEAARNRVVKALGGESSKGLLLLPGQECIELWRLKDAGVLTQATLCEFVEADQEAYQLLSKQVRMLWNQWGFSKTPTIHNKPFSDITEFGCLLDLVHLDLCGNLTYADALCLRDIMRHRLSQGGQFLITFTNATRGNRFIPAIINTIAKKMSADYTDTRAELIGTAGVHLDFKVRSLIAGYSILFKRFIFGPDCKVIFSTAYLDEVSSSNYMIQLRVNGFSTPDLLLEDFYTAAPNEKRIDMPANKKPAAKTNAVSFAQQLVNAITPAQKAVMTRRIRAYVKLRQSQGADPIMVVAGIKAAVTRLTA